MRPFAYVRASDEGAAVRAAQPPGATLIAGGTGLVDLMRRGVEAPSSVVDINRLPWSRIEERREGLRIGALVKNTELAYDARVQRRLPVLSEALLSGASAQVHNMALVAGNLLQRARCSYFRDPGNPACNKRTPGEFVTHVLVPTTPLAARSVYLKTRDRVSFAFARASAAVALSLDGNVIRAARVALGGVGTKPWRSLEAEQVLIGQRADPALFTRAAEAALQSARALRDNAFKIELAKRVIVRALER